MNDRRSTTSYCTYIRGDLVTWRSKETINSRSSNGAEFRALAQGIGKECGKKSCLEN